MKEKDYSEYPEHVRDTVERTDQMIEQLEQTKELIKAVPDQVEEREIELIAESFLAVGYNATSTGVALRVAKEKMIAAGLFTTEQEKN